MFQNIYRDFIAGMKERMKNLNSKKIDGFIGSSTCNDIEKNAINDQYRSNNNK